MMSSFSVGINKGLKFGVPFIRERCNEVSYAIIKKWVSQFWWEPRWTRSRSWVAKVNQFSWVDDREARSRSRTKDLGPSFDTCVAEPVKFYFAWIACTGKYFYSLWHISLRIFSKEVISSQSMLFSIKLLLVCISLKFLLRYRSLTSTYINPL